MNKIREMLDPNSDYNRRIATNMERIQRRWVEERDCFACKHCKDISDDRNTCHLCYYTNDLLPEEQTCLLWEGVEE